jgi:hypothetical protein
VTSYVVGGRKEPTMESVLLGLAVLACPVGMGLMMWFMARGTGSGSKPDADSATSVEDLRARHRRLGAEIERLERESPPSVAETRR